LKYAPSIDPEKLDPDMPIEYVTGWCEFKDRVFRVDQNTLIPRVETEELVDLAIEESRKIIESLNQDQPLMIADVGTGSGAIGLSVFLELVSKHPCKLFLSDISESALQVAKTNTFKLAEDADKGGVKILTSNLFNSYPQEIKFEIVTANLPYVPLGRIGSLPDSVVKYEPITALDGGVTGLDVIDKLLQQLPEKLANAGVAILEIDEGHTLDNFKEWVVKFDLVIKKDSLGKNRFLVVKEKKADKS
jgi:release factor glutamine methyltransferase